MREQGLMEQLPLFPDLPHTQGNLFEWAAAKEEGEMGEVIDLSYELRVRHLARDFVRDLGLDEAEVASWGGGLKLANEFLDLLENLCEFDQVTIEEDHEELFQLLRARAGR